MSDTRDCPVLIVGSGPAGWTAAIYAARAALAPVVIRGLQPGGQLTITTDVENYPGFAEVVQGPWLMEQMEAQARAVGVDVRRRHRVGDRPRQPAVCLHGRDRHPLPRPDGCPRNRRHRPLAGPGFRAEVPRTRGIGLCHVRRLLFQGQGSRRGGRRPIRRSRKPCSSPSSHQRSRWCTGGDKLRAERILQDRLIAEPRVEIAWNSVVEEILGDADGQTVAGVRLRSTNGGATRELAVEGVFVAIGHDPNTGLVRDQVETDADGYIKARPGSTATSVSRFLRRRRRPGQGVSPGRDCSGPGLHGSPRS